MRGSEALRAGRAPAGAGAGYVPQDPLRSRVGRGSDDRRRPHVFAVVQLRPRRPRVLARQVAASHRLHAVEFNGFVGHQGRELRRRRYGDGCHSAGSHAWMAGDGILQRTLPRLGGARRGHAFARRVGILGQDQPPRHCGMVLAAWRRRPRCSGEDHGHAQSSGPKGVSPACCGVSRQVRALSRLQGRDDERVSAGVLSRRLRGDGGVREGVGFDHPCEGRRCRGPDMAERKGIRKGEGAGLGRGARLPRGRG